MILPRKLLVSTRIFIIHQTQCEEKHMIIIMKPNASQEAIDRVTQVIQDNDLRFICPGATRSPSSVS